MIRKVCFLVSVIGIVFLAACTDIENSNYYSNHYLQYKERQKEIAQKEKVNDVMPVYDSSPRRLSMRVPHYDAISTVGLFEIRFAKGPRTGEIYLRGHSSVVSQLYVAVRDKILYMEFPEEYLDGSEGKVTAILTVCCEINKMDMIGEADVKYFGIRANALDLKLRGTGNIVLTGKVGTFHAEIDHDTNLNAKGLYAERAYINAADTSIARVMVSDALNVLATGNSNVYYYRDPRVLAGFPRTGGSVIRMTNIKSGLKDRY